jgi:hypothetical protein
MPKILCTHPGKLGDVLWALPTVRHLAEAYGEPVDFLTSAAFKHACEIVAEQPYVRHAGYLPDWQIQDTAPMTPWMPPPSTGFISFTSHRGESEGLCWDEAQVEAGAYDHIYHLGYRRWPALPLPFEVAATAGVPEAVWKAPEYLRPWLRVASDKTTDVAIGFTDEWFELKFGLFAVVARRLADLDYFGVVLAAPGSRWATEGDQEPWILHDAAALLQGSKVFLGCLSSLAVLACGMGKPRVLVEPNPNRHHPIFQHPDQGLVLGGDGKPTFDARHVADALREKLRGLR